MDFTAAKAKQAEIEAEFVRLADITGAFPRYPNGLTPDHIKFSPEYQAAKQASNAAFQRLRQFNGWFVKTFKAELRKERLARRAA
jgi:hypothetical protein